MNAFFVSFLGLLCLIVLRTLQIAYRRGIRRVPGPWLAKFSILYRVSLVTKGRAVQEYLALHRKYGAIVRVGPRHVSINDPTAIQQIYGISSKFRKVWLTSSNDRCKYLIVIQVRILLRVSALLRGQATR